MRGLIEGRIVHFVLDNGEHRPAVVVKVWDHEPEGNGCSNLQVFVDGRNDSESSLLPSPNATLSWQTSILYSAEAKPRTWHWIEKS